MYQDFDTSEFGSELDYLNSELQQFEQPNQVQKTNEISGIERFWKLTGNLGEFGAYFSGGLAASLIIRAIPALIPAAVILVPGIGIGLAVYIFCADGILAKRNPFLILIALATALVAGNWDAWQAWIIANSQMLIFSFAIIVITVGFVGAQIWSKLNNAR
jgi:hypothetical protein